MKKIIVTGEMDGEQIWREETAEDRIQKTIYDTAKGKFHKINEDFARLGLDYGKSLADKMFFVDEEELLNEAKRITYERD